MQYRYDKDSIHVQHLQVHVLVTPFQGGIFRIQAGRSLDIPPSFAGVEHPPLAKATLSGTDAELRVEAEGYHLVIRCRHPDGDRSALNFSFSRSGLTYAEGTLFRETDDGFCWKSSLEREDRVYGLGEKTGFLDKRGRSWTMWNTDEPNQPPYADPLYQAISWFFTWNGERSMGVLFDTVARSCFDVGDRDTDELTVTVDDDAMDCYFIPGEEPRETLKKYTKLTGTMSLPPLWSLGFQQCRYSYYPDLCVVQLAETFRRKNIPCDVIYLDIHYMEAFKIFTWSKSRFPDPKALLSKLREQGFRVVIIVDPGVKIEKGYQIYEEGLAQDMFCLDAEGKAYEGEVWPGPAVYPDFSKQEVRAWWADWHRETLGIGVSGIWNDMNEPSNFSNTEDQEKTDRTVPNSVYMEHDGHRKPFSRYHNAYAIEMNRSTQEAFAKVLPDARPFVLTRAGSPGIQKYAAVWTGDNSSWWEHFATSLPMLMNLGLSGVPFVGCDAGGFQDNSSPELYARWIAAASFTPFFRAHSMLDSKDHEPWSFTEEVEAIARKYISLRYELLPYLYTLFEHASREGAPIMQALLYRYPFDKNTWNLNDQFLVGGLMIAPVLTPGVTCRSVYLPAGIWYDYWTGERYEGGRNVLAEAPLDVLPIYVRGGSMITRETLRQHTGEQRQGSVTVQIYADVDDTAEGSLYDDAGDGFAHRDGEFCRIHFSLVDHVLTLRKEGSRPLSWNSLILMLGDKKRVIDASLGPEFRVEFV